MRIISGNLIRTTDVRGDDEPIITFTTNQLIGLEKHPSNYTFRHIYKNQNFTLCGGIKVYVLNTVDSYSTYI